MSVGLVDMERAMGTGLGESGFRRVVVIGGATLAAMVALVFAKPIYSAASYETAAISVDAGQHVAVQQPKTEAISFVPSPTVDTNPLFFFGTGDGSNGYYDERPQPTQP
jgi:hypothetical protein